MHRPTVVRLAVWSLLVAACAACEAESPSLEPDVATDMGPPPVGRDMRTEAGPPDAASADPDITLEPRALTLLSDVDTPSEPGFITVSNVGGAPLAVTAVALGDDPAFALAEPFEPTTVDPGDAFDIGVVFTPARDGDAMTTLTIVSDDPDEARLVLPISGRTRESCLRAMPGSVNLGSVAVGGESARFSVQINNCGDRPVQVGEITFDGDPGFGWEVEQGMGAGQALRPGDRLVLALWYDNTDLGIDALATTALIVGTDLPTGPLRINVRVTGGGGPSCQMEIAPGMVDYETLRIGLTRPIEFTVRNTGTAQCEFRGLAVNQTAGPEENGFVIEQGIDAEIIEGQSEATVVVAYAPTVANPLGDRGELRLSYHDPHLNQNRTAEALLQGVGAEALIGASPPVLDIGVTTAECASWTRSARAENVGFVPICVTGFRYEGDDCARFVPTEEPSVAEGDCIALDRGEAVTFSWVHAPGGVGEDECTLIVTSDAQNTQALEIGLRGTGTDSAATVDEREVGDLNRRRAAYFELSRPCVAETLQLFVNDEPTNEFGFDNRRNALVFEENNHPAVEGDTIRMEYDAWCFDLPE